MMFQPAARAARAAPLVLLLAMAAALPVRAQVDQFLKNVVQEAERPRGGPAEAKIAPGLKEALQLAAEKAVGLTGKPDGYFGNPAIRIPLPEKLQSIDKALRVAGLGGEADEFVLSMNRAAEQSAPAARQILVEAVRGIGFDDARRILGGGSTAATDYFRDKTSGRLTEAFAPIVRKNMNEVGVTRRFESLQQRIDALPFMKSERIDLDGYVIGKALEGLFHVMGEQEREIRENPVARTTALLKEVFAR